MWRVHKEAGRPWPVLSEDPVMDYMVMEAVYLRVKKREKKEREQAERDEFKKDRDKLKQHQ